MVSGRLLEEAASGALLGDSGADPEDQAADASYRGAFTHCPPRRHTGVQVYPEQRHAEGHGGPCHEANQWQEAAWVGGQAQ